MSLAEISEMSLVLNVACEDLECTPPSGMKSVPSVKSDTSQKSQF
jgi:hypothetical protein